MKVRILFILVIGVCNSLFAQKNFSILENSQMKFEHITSEDGLMHNSIATILQDSKGFMWFGTTNGLYKYDGYKFQFYSSSPDDDSTLLNKNVWALYEDKLGNLWVGTRGGLCRYDRSTNTFERYLNLDENLNAKNGIFDPINCIYEDKDGVLWVGSRVGLYQLTRLEDNSYDIKLMTYSNMKEGLSSNNIHAISEDRKGNLWIASGSGLNRLVKTEENSVEFKKYFSNTEIRNSLSSDNIFDLLVDIKDNLWLATKRGLNKMIIDEETGEVTFKVYLHDSSDSNSLSNNSISSLIQDHQGTIWVGTSDGGLNKFNAETESFKSFKHSDFYEESLRSNSISDLYEDKSGVLWIGTQRGGLSKLNIEKIKVAHYKYNYFESAGLSGDLINTIYEDSNNNVWVATFNNGLNRLVLDNGNSKFIHYKHESENKNSLSSNSVFGICEDNFGNFWVGTQSDGLNHTRISNPTSKNIEVKHYNNKPGIHNFPTNKLAVLYKDRIGDIWAGSFGGGGLMRFTPKQFNQASPVFHQFYHDASDSNSLSSSDISCIFEDSEGVLWVGTNGSGLNKVFRDELNNPIKYVRILNNPKNTNSLSDNSVFAIHEDAVGNIWIGTFGGGLNKISKEEKSNLNPKIVRYSTKDGLPSDEIYGILEDNNENLWISTNNGISKFNPRQNLFKNLHLSDGLQDVNFRKFAYLKSSKGLLFFGGINGLNIINPESIKENAFIPNVAFTDFKVFNKSVYPGEEVLGRVILEKAIDESEKITLKSSHNTFSFDFAALHYASPDQNKYSYKLEGFNEDWIQTDHTRRYATFSNLSSGTYTFMVKASNNDGVWSDLPKAIEIKVLPPFWKTWWAYLIYVGLIIGIMILFRRYILINEEYQNKLKIEKIEQEKIKEMNRMKLEFFTNVSHEFKTPLTLILGPLKELIASSQTNKTVKESLEMMDRNANQLFRLINQIMDFRKVEAKEMKLQRTSGDLVNFCREEVFSFKVLADKKRINLFFECGELKIEGFFDWDKMEKILNNLISNAIKYTNEDGIIRVSLSVPTQQNGDSNSKQSPFVRIVVEDTGEGIPENQTSLIFERFYQINRKRKAGEKGSGIGLALTKSLIDMHKGIIKVESEEKKGSKFIIDLPLLTQLKSLGQPSKGVDNAIKSKAVPMGQVRDEEHFEEVTIAESDKPHVLLVEDNADMLDFISKALKDDYNLLRASDGVQGLKIALKEVPDLIVSDVMMPNMDGIEFCKHIKENEISAHIPVILLTARGSTDHRIEGLEVGAESYIPKPFDMRHLEVRIKKLLKQRDSLKKKFTAGEIKLDSQKVGINQQQKDFLEKMEAVIEENLTNSEFGVEDLGSALGFSRMQLYRKLKSLRGLSANEFIREYRIKKSAVYLRETDMRIFEILYEVGISNHSYFTKCFKQYFKMSPRDYINEHRIQGSKLDV